MLMSPIKKVVIGLAAALAMMVSLMAAPASADPVIEGTITIKSSPEIVFEIPGDEEGVCADEAGVEFSATPTGDQNNGLIGVDIDGTGFMKKPGTEDWDRLDFFTVPTDQLVTYDLVGPGWTYDLEGFVIVYIEVSNTIGDPKDPEATPADCEPDPEGKSCLLGVWLDILPGSTHVNPTNPLPTIDPGSVTTLLADASASNGIQRIDGDCAFYGAVIDSDVQVDIEVTHD